MTKYNIDDTIYTRTGPMVIDEIKITREGVLYNDRIWEHDIFTYDDAVGRDTGWIDEINRYKWDDSVNLEGFVGESNGELADGVRNLDEVSVSGKKNELFRQLLEKGGVGNTDNQVFAVGSLEKAPKIHNFRTQGKEPDPNDLDTLGKDAEPQFLYALTYEGQIIKPHRLHKGLEPNPDPRFYVRFGRDEIIESLETQFGEGRTLDRARANMAKCEWTAFLVIPDNDGRIGRAFKWLQDAKLTAEAGSYRWMCQLIATCEHQKTEIDTATRNFDVSAYAEAFRAISKAGVTAAEAMRGFRLGGEEYVDPDSITLSYDNSCKPETDPDETD